MVSRVAKSISFSSTVFSLPSPYCSTRWFKIVDFPALVYPTRATWGIWERLRRLRMIPRSLDTVFSSLIRCSILRLSSSSLVSPAPLLLMLPPVPPWRLRFSRIPTSLGSIYCSLAASTCSFASLVLARMAKISRIRFVRSRIGSSSSFPRLRTWDGERVLSNRISSAPHSLA